MRPKLKLKCSDIWVRVKEDLTAIFGKTNEIYLCILKNMYPTPKENNYCDKHGSVIRPTLIEDYNRHTVWGRLIRVIVK